MRLAQDLGMDGVKVATYKDPGVGRTKGDGIVRAVARTWVQTVGFEGRLYDWSMMGNEVFRS